ncbi:MAG: hypothetical protein ABIZ69_15285 [Ilumatobacteraceae bacterium]
MTEYFGNVSDPKGLLPAEREPVTGRRVPSHRSKRSQPGHGVSSIRRAWLRPRALIGVAAAAALVVLIFALVRPGDDQRALTTASSPPTSTPARAVPASPTKPAAGPPTPAASITSAPATAALPVGTTGFKIYSGGTIVEQINTTQSDETFFVECRTDGCFLQLPFGAPGAGGSEVPLVAGHWTYSHTDDAGPICIPGDTGIPEGELLQVDTYDLQPVGTIIENGLSYPASLTGTFRAETPAVANCLPQSLFVLDVAATPLPPG